jgi:hypothetical protein
MPAKVKNVCASSKLAIVFTSQTFYNGHVLNLLLLAQYMVQLQGNFHAAYRLVYPALLPILKTY